MWIQESIVSSFGKQCVAAESWKYAILKASVFESYCSSCTVLTRMLNQCSKINRRVLIRCLGCIVNLNFLCGISLMMCDRLMCVGFLNEMYFLEFPILKLGE